MKDGVIVPNYDHSEVIEAVFKRTRVTVAVMTAAKLLSAIEPVIRYQRGRFRGAEQATPGTLRYELGLQQREDVLHRLVDVWAMGESAASLAFAAARCFDVLDPLEKEKTPDSGRKRDQRRQIGAEVLPRRSPRTHWSFCDCAAIRRRRATIRGWPSCTRTTLVQYAILDSVASVLCPASKLWNTGQGSVMMREAVSLMGGYGITEDCPGFLGHKWMDSQLEATYEGPGGGAAPQPDGHHDQRVVPGAVPQLDSWRCGRSPALRPGTGACALATRDEAVAVDLMTICNTRPTPTAPSCTTARGKA